MALDIPNLVTADTLIFTPASGHFDVEAIAAAIADIDYSFRDEADPSRFVLVSDERARDAFQARRRADPSSRFPYTPLVTVTPDQVVVAPISSHPDLRELSAAFIAWLDANTHCVLQNPPEPDANEEDEGETTA